MAHYAYLDGNNVVLEVIVGRDEDDLEAGISSWETYFSEKSGLRCLRTSYNTVAGEHLNGGTPFRGNYAGVGWIYDAELDAFLPPKPFDSWALNMETFSWEAPIPYPNDGAMYKWDESLGDWVEVV